MSTNHLSRRDIIKLGLASGLMIASSGIHAYAHPHGDARVEFLHGVASGDPLQDSVVLWTRAIPVSERPVTIGWQVAKDRDFIDLVNMDEATVSAARDYTVKVDVKQLEPDTIYYYRFYVGTTFSPVGRTKTIAANPEQVRFAVMSCSNYPAGYFNVYREVLNEGNIDAVLHLGDYIYEYGRGEYASEAAASMGREVEPAGECISLQDYRQRYAQYRRDADLQALHAAYPWIVVWDDHEIANDAWQDGAENHDSSEGSYEARKAASLQAYFEWLPLRPLVPDAEGRIYRQFSFGNLVNLLMLDTRRIGRDEQLSYANYLSETGDFAGAAFSQDISSPERSILGEAQRNWLQEQLSTSTATWQVLGQQVLMARMLLPAPILLPDPLNPQVPLPDYARIATTFGKYQAISAQLSANGLEVTPEALLENGMNQRELELINDPAKQAIAQAPSVPYNLDAWDGYAYDREVILATARAAKQNLVSLAGDTHNAWASDLTDLEGTIVGTELATGSVTSPGLENILGLVTEDAALMTEQLLNEVIKDLNYSNLRDRGYMLVSFTADKAVAKWVFVDTVHAKEYRVKEARGHQLELFAQN